MNFRINVDKMIITNAILKISIYIEFPDGSVVKRGVSGS